MNLHGNETAGRLRRGLTALRDGTLPERLRRKWRESGQPRRRAWWQRQRGRVEHVDVAIQGGVRMRLYLDDELSRLIYCDDFEMAERLFLNHFLRRGDVFVDVGCNIGLFTLIAARRVGGAGHVYGFEPCSRTFARLEANLRLNAFANIAWYRVSLSDRRGEATLTAPVDGYGAWGSLAHPVRGQSLTTETVTTIPWDDFAQEHQLIGRVAAMKIDVEGWEARVLSGASKTLSRGDAPLLQVELTEDAARMAGSTCAELYHLPEELGNR